MPDGRTRDIVVIGGSAGAIEAVTTIVRALPRELKAAVAIVVHHYERVPSIFGKILDMVGTLPAVTVADQTPLEPGRIYVPVSDRHLVIEPGVVRATRSAKENRARPAVDPLFRSAARAYGRRVIGIILTGNLDDGTAGLRAVKRVGGLTVVQDPEEAIFDGMPRSALEHVEVDHTVKVEEVAPLIVAATESNMGSTGSTEPTTTNGHPSGPGPLVPVTCPTCHGVLRETDDGEATSFSCHTGHTFGAETLLEGQDEDVEIALWSAVRALQEKMMLLERLIQRPTVSDYMRERHGSERKRIEHHVATLRRLLESD
jgi:two-component system chemotaxis response regulator CheB